MEHLGYALNPWDTSRAPGGSSSGAGTALAARLTPLAMGSDTGGSVRIPASFCGLVSVKPTHGLVSRVGILPVSWSFDSAGPMARSVEDAAMLLGAIVGADPRDPSTVHREVPDYAAGLLGSLSGVRLGVPESYFYESLDPEVEENTRAALARMQELGATLHTVDIPHLPYAVAALWCIAFPELLTVHRANLATRAQDFGTAARRRIASGGLFTAEEGVTARRIREVVTGEFLDALAEVDVLVTPTTPITAFRVDEAGGRERDVGRLTRPVSLTGLPAVSAPTGFTAGGLPTSMQIVARPWQEGTALGVAHAYEQSVEWQQRRPSLTAAPEPGFSEPARRPESRPAHGIDAAWVRQFAELTGLTFLTDADAEAIAESLGPVKGQLAAAPATMPPTAEPAVRPVPVP